MKNESFIKYANSFQSIAKLRLESIRELCSLLGSPQDSLKFIHIAGTNGKGSVCSFLQNILTQAGYKTGKYTSPNMLSVNERINIDGKEISDNELNSLLSSVEKMAEEVKHKTGELPTQFEIWTAAAFLYFKKQKCDYVVLETGLGGTRDATNIINNPVITVITKIALDHTEYLGNTLKEIAGEKAGIIKKSIYGGCTVCALQENEAYETICEAAKSAENRLITAEKPFIHPFTPYYEKFDYKNYKNLKISLIGEHQAENASLAIECADYLGIDEIHIRTGLEKAANIGRLDLLSKNPPVLFDGAHNKNGMQSLSKALKRCFSEKDICFIMGFMRDKDICGALTELSKNGYGNSNVFAVSVKNNTRAATPEELCSILLENSFLPTSCESIKDAYKKALNTGKMIVVCGSLYLYKDFYEEIGIDKISVK